MKAVVYSEYGSPDVLRLADVEKHTPQADELLVRVHATTVTTGDCNMRGFVFVPSSFRFISRLMFGYNKPKKQILGVEFAGEVAAVGKGVTSFQVGDAVFGIDSALIGAYAEYKRVRESAAVLPMPSNLTYEQAAAIPNGALTAYTFLANIAKIQNGQDIVIIGASGSIGTAAVQIAKFYGAHVTGICSGKNADLVLSLGADRVIDYTKEDFTKGSQTYDFVFDTVGKSSFDASRAVLKPNGVYLNSAGGLGAFVRMAITGLFGKQKLMAGISSESKQDLIVVKEMVEAGHLKPVIDRRYPLEEIVEAHRYVDTGRKRGNVVITVVPSGAA